MAYSTLKNAKVTIDKDTGSIWIWIESSGEQAGAVVARPSDPYYDVFKSWAIENGAAIPPSTD